MSFSIAILAPSPVPYQLGGTEKSLWLLREALGELEDCQAELVKLPFREDNFADILDGYERFSSLDLRHFDMLITTKYPAWMADHPNHVVYMYHPLRGLYDLYWRSGAPKTLDPVPAPLADLVALLSTPNPDRGMLPQLFEMCRRATQIKSLPATLFNLPGPLLAAVVHFMDRIALSPKNIRGFYALSRTVAEREGYFPEGVDVGVLHLPPGLAGLHEGRFDYFFTASRLTTNKRIDLLVEAMRHVKTGISLKIAGTGPELAALQALAARDRRIEFVGAVTERELAEYYANALAVPFVPEEEDYGLITQEAFASGKPVITTTDSGGPTELVQDGKNGLVVPPTPEALGAALESLAVNPALARRLGQAAANDVASWKNVATGLVSRPEAECFRHKILVVAPYPADRHGAGGPRRLYHVCAVLSAAYDVKLLTFGSLADREPTTRMPGPHWQQITLPWPPEAIAVARSLTEKMGTSADDIVLSRYAGQDAQFMKKLAELGDCADFVLISHPWLVNSVTDTLPEIPLALDAHNVETDLKKALYGDGSLAREAAQLEEKACSAADVIFVSSGGDLQRLTELYNVTPGKLHLLPNGCDPMPKRRNRAALRQRLPYKDEKLVLFIGSGHKPNVDAALAMMDMAAQMPDVQFLAAGTVCGEKPIVERQKPDNVHLLDTVSEDVKNVLLESCDLALNPVVEGSGTNLKMVEYLSCAIPTISTPFGMRGIPALPGVTICELARFPEAIRKELANPTDQSVMARTADEISSAFAWPSVLNTLNGTVAAHMENHHASAD